MIYQFNLINVNLPQFFSHPFQSPYPLSNNYLNRNILSHERLESFPFYSATLEFQCVPTVYLSCAIEPPERPFSLVVSFPVTFPEESERLSPYTLLSLGISQSRCVEVWKIANMVMLKY